MHALVAALDWGFGHTTRTIALIHFLKEKGYRISIACTHKQKAFFKTYFPNEKYYTLPPLNFENSLKVNFTLNVVLQLPKLFRCIQNDKTAVATILENDVSINLIVSDNRYGFRHKALKNVLVCHQLSIQFPKAIAAFKPLFNLLYNRLLNLFNEIWIPDRDKSNSLTGALSREPVRIKNKCKRIGILSRFQLINEEQSAVEPKPLDYLFLISGEENQRTLFENKIVSFVSHLSNDMHYLIVRGLVNEKAASPLKNSVNNLSDSEFSRVVKHSKTIVARAGYSTIMDLMVLGKSAVLVPTSGQTEQEYLATYLSEKALFSKLNQEELHLLMQRKNKT